MKKMNFVLKNGNNTVSDIITEYEVIEDGVSFKYEMMDIFFKGNEEVMIFKRETEEDVFTIMYDKNECKGFVELKDHDVKVDIPIINFKYEYTPEKIIIKYTLDDEEKEEKTIIFSFLN